MAKGKQPLGDKLRAGYDKIKSMPPPTGEPAPPRPVDAVMKDAGPLRDILEAEFVTSKFEPGGIFQTDDYYVQIVAFEKTKKGATESSMVRYRKGVINEIKGEIEWKPEVLSPREPIEKWLKGGQ